MDGYTSISVYGVSLHAYLKRHEEIDNIAELFRYVIYDEEYNVLTLISFGRPSASLSIAI